MKKIKLLILILLVTQQLFAKQKDKVFQILPAPQQIEFLSGRGLTHSELSFLSVTADTPIPVLSPLLDRLPQAAMKGKGVALTLSDVGVPDSPEGYLLTVTAKGVAITARTKAGLFYGCQTLEQLMEDSRDFNKAIPAMRITDYPSLAYRAVHFDSKHHLSRMEYYYRVIDKLARYKVNAVIWELEDKLRFVRRPEVGAPNAISKQEMKALSRYAADRNVEISPLVQGLGHAGFILKHHWELRETPTSDWEFCPSDPRTYEVQFDLYLDAMEALPHGKYLHVGGDEVGAIGIDERCKETGKTPFELQMIWLRKVCDFAVSHGRTPIFWDDMPLKHGNLWALILGDASGEALDKAWNTEKLDAAIKLFPKECIYMRWNYGDPTKPAHKRLLKWYHDKGIKVMAATAASAGDSPFLPRKDTRSHDIKAFSQLVEENQLEGILATAWDDGSPHWETVMRGFIAQGEFGWNPTARDVEAFKVAHAQREFGFNSTDNRMGFLEQLEQAAFFFDGALVVSGRRNPAWQTRDFKLIALPNSDTPGVWSDTYKEKIVQAKAEESRYKTICEGIQTAQRTALRNRYTLDIYEKTAALLNYPVRLILSLHAYDMAATEAERCATKKEIQCVLDAFSTMRNELEAVYSEVRFMQRPEGFISDLNHHSHLAAKTNNSDWLYIYELPMIKQISQWLLK
jgi:hypothetical protein